MAKGNTQEERQLIKLIEKMPVSEEERNGWSERIRSGDMSAELAEEIRVKLATPVEGEDEQGTGTRTRYLAELANLVRRWRLSSQTHNFGRK
jgi:hypothetical protein